LAAAAFSTVKIVGQNWSWSASSIGSNVESGLESSSRSLRRTSVAGFDFDLSPEPVPFNDDTLEKCADSNDVLLVVGVPFEGPDELVGPDDFPLDFELSLLLLVDVRDGSCWVSGWVEGSGSLALCSKERREGLPLGGGRRTTVLAGLNGLRADSENFLVRRRFSESGGKGVSSEMGVGEIDRWLL
jgi:hypothetical protein